MRKILTILSISSTVITAVLSVNLYDAKQTIAVQDTVISLKDDAINNGSSYARNDDVQTLYDCVITDLDEYGFEQVGDVQEYVCADKDDKTDFIIVQDYGNFYDIDDEITISKR